MQALRESYLLSIYHSCSTLSLKLVVLNPRQNLLVFNQLSPLITVWHDGGICLFHFVYSVILTNLAVD